MNDNLTKLLEQLASKLGTTSEYLWAILVKQAYVSATIDLLFLIFTVILFIVLYSLNKRFCRIDPKTDDTTYDTQGMIVGIPMVLGGIILFFLILDSLCNIPNIINGYFNPEYWALQHILEQIK